MYNSVVLKYTVVVVFAVVNPILHWGEGGHTVPAQISNNIFTINNVTAMEFHDFS